MVAAWLSVPERIDNAIIVGHRDWARRPCDRHMIGGSERRRGRSASMSPARPNEAAIRAWCTNYLAQTLELPCEEIGPETRFVRLGLDSASAVHFIVELEEWLGIELQPELAFDHPTIADLARHLAERCSPGDRAQ
jgi:acyl carrier protein